MHSPGWPVKTQSEIECATAPYDCPKSAIILSSAANRIADQSFPANGYLTGPANLVSNQYEYTLEVVFRLDAISGYRSVINFDGMAGDDAVFVQDGKIRFFNLANVQPSVAAPVTAAGWHRLIVTRKAVSNELIAYVDGVAVLTTTDQNNRYAADMHN